MAAPIKRQWGQNPPISEALPTERDLELNAALIEELKDQNNFEKPEDTDRRVEVLNRFQKVTEEFIKHVGREKHLAQSVIDGSGGKVFTFGSYRLGVFGPGSDIDTLVVAPKHVTREDFFTHFPGILERMSQAGAIEELTAVPDAFTPIIKIEYSGISIDLIFAHVNVSTIPLDFDLSDNSLLRGLDEFDLRSVNGTRVTDEILALVPQVKTFRQAVRTIKLWAQRRAIYGNVFGFPGGVAWAMMVARICQLYPMASGSTVVAKVFALMKDWPWPMPVMLKNIEDGPLQVRVWNPAVYPSDKRHLMPIITPAFPSMCATHNITLSTKQIIIQEMKRANEIANEVYAGKKTWNSLFQRQTFFSQGYKYYLSIVTASRTKDAQQKWYGLVQSKVRLLVQGIERSEAGVELAHPFNKGFDRVHECKNDDDIDKVLQGSIDFRVKTTTTDESNALLQDAAAENKDKITENGESQKPNVSVIYTTTFYIGIELMEGSKSLDISFPVADFKRQCTEWPQYDPDVNSVRIVHTRNYDLPDDVFEQGETRPVKTKRAKIKSKETGTSKRSATQAGMDGTDPSSAKKRQSSNGVATPAG